MYMPLTIAGVPTGLHIKPTLLAVYVGIKEL